MTEEQVKKILAEQDSLSVPSSNSVSHGNGVGLKNVNSRIKMQFGLEYGLEIESEAELLPLLQELAEVKREYDRIAPALDQARAAGYGIVMPETEELILEEPEIIQQGGRFGVRLRAKAPSIHMIRAEIQTEISPIVGTESQSRELADSLLGEFDGDSDRIWQSNIFGKSLHELVTEGLNAKLSRMPDASRAKFQDTLQRIVNEGAGGLICILL